MKKNQHFYKLPKPHRIILVDMQAGALLHYNNGKPYMMKPDDTNKYIVRAFTFATLLKRDLITGEDGTKTALIYKISVFGFQNLQVNLQPNGE